jgi:hypothetical protein
MTAPDCLADHGPNSSWAKEITQEEEKNPKRETLDGCYLPPRGVEAARSGALFHPTRRACHNGPLLDVSARDYVKR